MNIAKMKQKIADNKEEIKAWTVIAGVATVYFGMIFVAVKQQKSYQAQVEAQRKKLTDAINRGATVLPNTDGSFWILDPIK